MSIDIRNKNYELEKTSWLEKDTIKHHFLLYQLQLLNKPTDSKQQHSNKIANF